MLSFIPNSIATSSFASGDGAATSVSSIPNSNSRLFGGIDMVFNKFLTVIVPIYGVEKFLPQCLDSILDQTYRNLEIILVDDGSKDLCPEICDRYASRDARIKVIHKTNGGYGAAVNAGLDAAAGEWIGIVEPDDWIEPNMYEDLSRLANDDVDIVKADYTAVYPDGVVKRKKFELPLTSIGFDRNECDVLWFAHPSIWTCIYRRSFLIEYGIRMKEVPGSGWTDNPFFYETICQARRIRYLNESVYNYRSDYVDPTVKNSNWKFPHDRIVEIYDWLESKKYSPEFIARAILIRSSTYMCMMSLMTKNRSRIVKAIRDVATRMEPYLEYAPNDLRMMHWQYKHMPRLRMFRNRHPRILAVLRPIESLIWGV